MNDTAPRLADILLVFAGWMALWWILMTRPRGEKGPERRRDRRSLLGMGLQGAAFGLAWGAHRGTGLVISGPMGAAALARTSVIAALIGASLVIVFKAVRTLGKQWSLTARVLESHRLVTEGPYRLVRHPIYTAMLGLLLATGLALSRWEALLAAVVLYAIGTRIRIGVEERLLRETFGSAYDEYARQVGAFVPRPGSFHRPSASRG